MFRKFFVAIPIAVLAIGGSTACATKKFVRTSVGEVNEKVDSQGRAIEETQERTRKNEGRIGEVDQKAAAAAQSAQAANDAATAANANATRVGTEANGKFDAIDKASKRLVYEVVLSEDQGNFKFGKTTLPDEAKAKIDEMVAQMKQDPKNIYLEIEGHTDNVGAKTINEKIGLERAQAVQRYLYEQYQVPLHKMNVISYGMEKPVAPNKTKAGRAQNRRVVIKVLA
jgi:peptidoglycan-associated lipoprotein